jgi:hypothetical protein
MIRSEQILPVLFASLKNRCPNKFYANKEKTKIQNLLVTFLFRKTRSLRANDLFLLNPYAYFSKSVEISSSDEEIFSSYFLDFDFLFSHIKKGD